MKRGRHPLPTAFKVLRGNPGKRPLPEHEPSPAPAPLEPPTWLDDVAKVEWARVAPMLAQNGVLTNMDVDALVTYCETWVRWKEATQQIKRYGMVIKDTKGRPVVSPYVKIAEKAIGTLRSLLIEFGMTPSARVRVQTTPEHQVKVSKWAGDLG